MEPTIYRFIWRHSARQQLFVLLLTLASFPVLYGTLELPKRVVNQAIAGKEFPKTVAGFELDQIAYLFVLCVVFLALVCVNGLFKFYINVYKGRLGERLLRLMRSELCLRVMRFPAPHFRHTSPGELIPMIIAELEPVGGFIGDAVALPVFQGGTLLTMLIFMFAQDWALGLAAISLYPLQAWIIPRLQRRVNQLNRERVQEIRRFSDGIGETVPAIPSLRANGGVPVRLAQASVRLQRIYDVRLNIFQRKF